MISKVGVVFVAVLAMPALAEMQALDDDTLSSMNGQGGVYLSGEFSINKDGGVLWSKPASNNPSTWTAGQRSCATAGASTPENCGMRVAIRSEADGGWYVLDNLKGVFSFEGLTLRTRTINSGFNGDGAAFNQDVLEFGLPNEMKFKDGKLKSLLKLAVRGVIPDQLIDRPKQGFGVPVYEWCLDRLGQKMKEELKEFCAQTEFLDWAGVEALFDRKDGPRLWYLYNFALWHKNYFFCPP